MYNLTEIWKALEIFSVFECVNETNKRSFVKYQRLPQG